MTPGVDRSRMGEMRDQIASRLLVRPGVQPIGMAPRPDALEAVGIETVAQLAEKVGIAGHEAGLQRDAGHAQLPLGALEKVPDAFIVRLAGCWRPG